MFDKVNHLPGVGNGANGITVAGSGGLVVNGTPAPQTTQDVLVPFYKETIASTAQIKDIVCPSESNLAVEVTGHTSNDVTGLRPAKINYIRCSGDWPDYCPYTVKGVNKGKPFYPNPRCVMPEWNSYNKMSATTDGTSNTIVIGEKCVAGLGGAEVSNGPDVRYAVQNVPGALAGIRSTHSPATSGQPSLCMTTNVAGKNYVVGATVRAGAFGARWADGNSGFTNFSTILPPNGPNCYEGDHDTNQSYAVPSADDRVLHSASSHHPGGANVARLDGSVTFVSDGVDTGDLTKLAVESGKSPYGVWGAMGSANGGESKAL